jgi:hypothetical protein
MNALTNVDENEENTSDEDGKPPALERIVEMTNSGGVSRSARLVDKDQQTKS